MTVTNYNDLRGLFLQNSTEKRPAPFWTLYAVGLGSKDTIIHRNELVDNLENSFGLLAETIRRVNNPAGTVFRVFQTDRPGGNMSVAEYRVQIFDSANPNAQHVAGIGSLPGGYIGEAELEKRLKEAEEKWELKQRIRDLEAEQESNNWIGKIPDILEKVAASPIGAVFMAKMMNVPLNTAMPNMAPINGTPASDSHNGPDDPTDEDERISNAIDEIEDSTGLSAAELLEKIARVARHNPDYIKNVASQL